MSLSSYLGDSRCKQQALDRLVEMEKSGHLVPRPIYWSGREGSLVGSLLQGDDLDEWERQLGLPKWFALAIDNLFTNGPNLKASVAWGLALLGAIPIGVDLGDAGSRIIIELLDGETYGLSSAAGDGSLREVSRSVVALHRETLRGSIVEGSDWRTIRRHAVAQTNALPADSVDAAIGACVESAAWDPRVSRTAVSDTCRSWQKAASGISMARQSTWTSADDDRIKSLLDRLHAEAKADALDDDRFVDVFKLLNEKHPEQAAQLKSHIRLQETSYAKQWGRVTQLLHSVVTHAKDEVRSA